ncbi:putative myosin light chain kinase [Porphyridium purpureum]|uniref:Putative myosin light chain kinase n=1 Tax=Porphyridium purpureum TaxID=35688 RepID=A0A5J4YKV6_PORPP|nr:putative myosin light chain kinase [Porphyridium purpureum]|eukprot:POR9253..scf244_11
MKDVGLFRPKGRRLFRLKGTVLTQFSEEDNTTEKWSSDLWGTQVIVNPKLREITLQAADKKIIVCALTDADYENWSNALLRATGTAFKMFYELGKQVGAGAYGQVFEGRNLQTNERVAIKSIEKSRASQKELKYIQRESAILTRVSHPHVVRTYDVFDMGNTYLFVMEYMSGGELFDKIAEAKFFSEAQAADVMKQLMSGVQYLHQLGVVHRDIKPENILCVDNSWPVQIRLTDFGLSNVMDVTNTKDQLVSYVGTPNYYAPEVFLHQKYGFPVDIFSSGVVLYIMLSGKFPFWGKTESEYWERLKKGVRFPPKQWERVSSAAKNLITHMLDLDPARRPTCSEVLEHQWFSLVANQGGETETSLDMHDLSRIHSKRREDDPNAMLE